ncbi:MAG: UDP-glucose--hexose-1-phosphate uridylyltransferase [Bacteroidales bacterium]|nr:UDP-glucose--hexose-1-phosphate uridylyltransferase [Lachnoclostridium sp.]MCM1385373.1 UDP-glucose--hexose-1-phosphate uridylyltransferase [Lachnoclostridium sp.]MCM1466189.1 UDP-glucose--hexose-1-phosphate uridylyltransferase [Bacteroidales bacterium]
MIQADIKKLTAYGVRTGLVPKEDIVYTVNRLLELFLQDAWEENGLEQAVKKEAENANPDSLEDILKRMLDYACEKGLIEENSIIYRELFDTKIMGLLMPRPSEVIRHFRKLYETFSPKEATDYYYWLSRSSDYIREYRIRRDEKWIAATEYGDLDITINLSKPEKDPKAIAAARNAGQSGYPKCLLCRENEGYAGRVDHPARQNHRVIPVTLNGSEWGFQYSPYVYYNEHCILFNFRHVPMKIDRATFCRLCDFVEQFPHYFVGSNADLPIVGGSILSHDHFQGGCYEFAMAKAPAEHFFSVRGFENVEAGIVKWPMSVIRLRSEDKEAAIDFANLILSHWREYTDEKAFIYAETEGEPHNTVTPIARKRDAAFELDLVLRNNITTAEHPMGVYHPHERLHHIKKENIGLIEVMGLAVLPARLKGEIARLKEAVLRGGDLRAEEDLAKHADWVEEFMPKYDKIDASNIDKIFRDEIGLVFMEVLEDAGVYKRTEEGKQGFLRFLESLNGR